MSWPPLSPPAWASRENGAHCGLCPQAQPSAQCQARSGLRCGSWALKAQEWKQSLPHTWPSCSGVFGGIAHALFAPDLVMSQ